MRLLLDSCVWSKATQELQNTGHDAVLAGDWDFDPGDAEILARAFAEHRILVTLDKDFGELAIMQNAPHCGILRIVNFPARKQAAVVLQILPAHGAELEAGAIVTAEPGRLRIRPASSDDDESAE